MRLIVADPGHFHATLLQKDMYPSLDSRVAVYAPLGRDVLDYLARIALFNSRAENATHWELDVHLSAHPMVELLRDRPGDIVVFTGKNRGKIDRIVSAIEAVTGWTRRHARALLLVVSLAVGAVLLIHGLLTI